MKFDINPPKPIPKYWKVYFIYGWDRRDGWNPNKKNGLLGVNEGKKPIMKVFNNFTKIEPIMKK